MILQMRPRFRRWAATMLRCAGLVCVGIVLMKTTFVHWPALLLLFALWLFFEARALMLD